MLSIAVSMVVVTLASILLAASSDVRAAEAAAAAAQQGGHAPNVVQDVTAGDVRFDSADGKTRLAGYLFQPAGDGPFPGIVLMHGRAGLHSTRPGAGVGLEALSLRHRHWARLLAGAGHVVVLVDSFTPRGYPGGFRAASYAQRPAEVSERTVRPLDAEGAASYLRGLPQVRPDRIGLMGWSNGAMAALAVVTSPVRQAGVSAVPAPGQSGEQSTRRSASFRAVIAIYPGCVVPERERARPSLPLLLVIAGDDREVSPVRCERWARSIDADGEAEPGPDRLLVWELMAGAAHNFDGLALGTRATAEDLAAAARTEELALAFFARHLGGD